MIRSMTGFGRASFNIDGVSFEIEARSVNHRHLDARIRLPRPLAALEPRVKQCVQERLGRGKVDLVVSMPEAGTSLQQLEIDRDLARAYVESARGLREAEGVAGELSVDALLALPGVARFTDRALPVEELTDALLAAVAAALEELDGMRVQEGAALERDLFARLESVRTLANDIEARSDGVQQATRERLRKRSEQLKQETGILDEARLHQEIVIAADRLDISEEIVRLRSHAEHFEAIVASAGPAQPVGRRLDFLMQEFGREANTIGSKASDSPIAHHVVELKSEIERIREQVQNVE